MKVLMLRETWGHMAPVSGFDPLMEAVGTLLGKENCLSTHVPSTIPKAPFLHRVLRRLKLREPILKAGNPSSAFVEMRHEWAAIELLERAREYPEARILISAGESQLGVRLCNAPEEIRKRMVVFFHHPPSWHRLHWRSSELLDGFGAVVALCKEQAQYLRSRTSTLVFELRHGVCSEYFRPGSGRDRSAPPRLVFVGQWFRDFRTLQEAMRLLWMDRPDVELDCVVPDFSRTDPDIVRLSTDARVRWHSGISPEKLRELYQEATLLFLPLVDATANNAVVEAMACGLPVIASRVGGIPDYLPEGAGQLCFPGDFRAHAHALLDWLNDEDRRRGASLIARNAAERLDWTSAAHEVAGWMGCSAQTRSEPITSGPALRL